MLIRVALSVLLAILEAAPAVAQNLPAGWRAVQQSDLGVDADFRNPKDAHVRGDFNGDGRIDHARILIPKANSAGRDLFVFLMLGDGKQARLKLHGCQSGCADYVLTPVRSGCYREEMTKVRVCLRHQGLVHLEAEYGTGTLYWLERGNWTSIGFGRATLSNFPQ